MTWCDTCSEYRSSVAIDDHTCCASCGEPIAEHGPGDDGETATVGQNAPWHFWLVVAALAGYLIWRFVDFVVSLFG